MKAVKLIFLLLFLLGNFVPIIAQKSTKANKSLPLSNIEAIIARPTITGSAYGAITKVVTYLLLKDGTIYSRPYLSPLDFDVDNSKTIEKHRWGTWVKKGELLSVHFKSQKAWKNVYGTLPAANTQKIEGIFQTAGGFSKSKAHRFNTLILEKNGRFTWRYFYRTKKVYQPHKSDKKISGSYIISGYTITFTFDDGLTERFLFAKYRTGKGIIIGDKSFYTFSHPLLK
ncbi:hypothetical protein [Aquimarina mytili]|uniref:Uncharacterized protein n=1 Tax=Aquimarina mytili TaxID=874423 RepID=A0A937DAI6_9FLAO|nr:hypothetical protein [Aquimarina mytili]MBL0682751.1 hypothetical protein [Aquimarina mytili]